jgi:hypothetical protein
LSLAAEHGLLGTHAIDAVPGFSLRESAIIGSSHNNWRCYNARFPNSLFYSFADPFVPVHDRSKILHPQSLHLPMIAEGRSACLPGTIRTSNLVLLAIVPSKIFTTQLHVPSHECLASHAADCDCMMSPRPRFSVAANGIWLSW